MCLISWGVLSGYLWASAVLLNVKHQSTASVGPSPGQQLEGTTIKQDLLWKQHAEVSRDATPSVKVWDAHHTNTGQNAPACELFTIRQCCMALASGTITMLLTKLIRQHTMHISLANGPVYSKLLVFGVKYKRFKAE